MKEEAVKVEDPVCGMRFEREEAAATTEYEGRTYHFCAEHCRRAFDADPGRFVRGERQG